jgi:hypothetical protein
MAKNNGAMEPAATESLLWHQVRFLRRHLGVASRATRSADGIA